MSPTPKDQPALKSQPWWEVGEGWRVHLGLDQFFCQCWNRYTGEQTDWMTEAQPYAKLRELFPFAQGSTLDELLQSQAEFMVDTQAVYCARQGSAPGQTRARQGGARVNARACRGCSGEPRVDPIPPGSRFKMRVVCLKCDIVVNGTAESDAIDWWNSYYGAAEPSRA
jgi:hypothetical protein